MDLFAWTRQLAKRRGLIWRRRRYELFLSLCNVCSTDTILDVGSGRGEALEIFNRTNEIVAVDIAPKRLPQWPNVRFQEADGRALPFADKSFDVAFSNSVIEHMSRESQQLFADEIRRVAHRFFVQTPNRYFPIEPHYQLPGFQFLPRRFQRFLIDRFQMGWQAKGNRDVIELLSATDLRHLFPDAEIHRERLFGLTKSLMAVRRLDDRP